MTATIKTRQQYLDSFHSVLDAGEWESTCLHAGREFLPPFALAVLENKEDERKGDDPIEPPPEYWQWLADQRAEAEIEDA